MELITIEGTITPSTFLSTGDRRKVGRTPLIDKLIARGYVAVVPEETPRGEAPTVGNTDDGSDVPSRGASRAAWAAFLTAHGKDFTEHDKRDDLVAIWFGEPDIDAPVTDDVDGVGVVES